MGTGASVSPRGEGNSGRRGSASGGTRKASQGSVHGCFGARQASSISMLAASFRLALPECVPGSKSTGPPLVATGGVSLLHAKTLESEESFAIDKSQAPKLSLKGSSLALARSKKVDKKLNKPVYEDEDDWIQVEETGDVLDESDGMNKRSSLIGKNKPSQQQQQQQQAATGGVVPPLSVATAGDASYYFTRSGALQFDDIAGAMIRDSGLDESRNHPSTDPHQKPGAAPPPPQGGGKGRAASTLEGLATSADGAYPAATVTDRIVMLEKLGQGASGRVYKAFDLLNLRFVAMKAVPIVERSKRRQIVHELHALHNSLAESRGGAHHEGRTNVVAFFDCFSHLPNAYVSLMVEYMDGGSLQAIVDQGGLRDERLLASLARQAARGVAFLHATKLVHRDLKPANMLINHRGDLKISDFGIVRNLETASSSSLHTTNPPPAAAAAAAASLSSSSSSSRSPAMTPAAPIDTSPCGRSLPRSLSRKPPQSSSSSSSLERPSAPTVEGGPSSPPQQGEGGGSTTTTTTTMAALKRRGSTSSSALSSSSSSSNISPQLTNNNSRRVSVLMRDPSFSSKRGFGSAAAAAAATSSKGGGGLKSLHSFVGTVTYMSPERINGEPYSTPADIWALGLTFLAVALGRLPVDESEGYWSLLASIRDAPSPTLPANDPDWSSDFRGFLAACLAKRPEDRATAADLEVSHAFIRDAPVESAGGVPEAEETRHEYAARLRGRAMAELDAMLVACAAHLARLVKRGARVPGTPHFEPTVAEAAVGLLLLPRDNEEEEEEDEEEVVSVVDTDHQDDGEKKSHSSSLRPRLATLAEQLDLPVADVEGRVRAFIESKRNDVQQPPPKRGVRIKDQPALVRPKLATIESTNKSHHHHDDDHGVSPSSSSATSPLSVRHPPKGERHQQSSTSFATFESSGAFSPNVDDDHDHENFDDRASPRSPVDLAADEKPNRIPESSDDGPSKLARTHHEPAS